MSGPENVVGLRDFALLAVLLATIPVAFFRPWIGVLTWTWIGLMNPHRLTWNLEQIPIAQMVAIALLAGVVVTSDKRSLPWTRETILLAILAAYFTVTSALAWHPEIAWPEWDKVSKILLFIFITIMMIRGRQRVRYLVLVIALSIGFYAIKGGIFSLLTGGQYRIWGPEGSFIGNNTSIGLALCMTLPLALVSAREEEGRWLRWLLYAVAALALPAILFTYSRGAFVGLLSVMPLLAWRYRRYALLLLPAVSLMLVVGYQYMPEKWVKRQESIETYEQDYSSMQRIQAWGVAMNVALDRPFLGAGYNFEEAGETERWLSYANFVEPWASQERAAHSIYFQVMGEHGLVALGIFLVLLFGTLWRLTRLARLERDPRFRWIGTYARAAQLSLVPYMTAGAFLSLAYFDLYFLLVALSAILEREYRTALAADAEENETSADVGGSSASSAPRVLVPHVNSRGGDGPRRMLAPWM